jgi:hypothetical protein
MVEVDIPKSSWPFKVNTNNPTSVGIPDNSAVPEPDLNSILE